MNRSPCREESHLSRSKHTRPDRILAASRVRAPFEARGKDDQSSFRRLARVLKESGINLTLPSTVESDAPVMPRIIEKRPRKDFSHPAAKADIVRVLQFFGERCFYGLRSIELIQGTGLVSKADLLMGRLEVPGRIVLFDQPPSPWFVNGSISSADREKLERAGALIESSSDNLHCLVHWTPDALKNFMLFDVLMHEVGHHLIQQYTGKRSARVVRTKDHENFADLFAAQCRMSFFDLSAADA